MKAEHRELEVKLDATGLHPDDFNRWCSLRRPSQYLHTVGTDVYYRQGKNVLRHRKDPAGGPGELTVKLRTSTKTTRNRVEIDLKLAASVGADDVARFLEATGWTPVFSVVKDCHIFWFSELTPAVEAVYYCVRCFKPDGIELAPRTFVEFEIHKADSNHPKARSVLSDWEKAASKSLQSMPLVHESLYEIFSGERYNVTKRKR